MLRVNNALVSTVLFVRHVLLYSGYRCYHWFTSTIFTKQNDIMRGSKLLAARALFWKPFIW